MRVGQKENVFSFVEGGFGCHTVAVDVGSGGRATAEQADRLAFAFQEFADHVARKMPLYRYLAERVAGDAEVAARLLLAPPMQQIPNLLFAAVHDVLLSGEGHDLAAWYGSITKPARPIGEGDDDPWPLFRELALTDRHVAQSLRTRSTQTNEVGRCAALLPALAQVAAQAPGAPPNGFRPLGLVEVGASAGLNLVFDHYGYCYEPSGPELNAGSALTLSCTLRGPAVPPVPAEFPPIASRVGLDLAPVDVSDRLQSRWLVACQWPDQPDRIHRARTAIALAHGDRPEVVAGDAVADLAPLVEGVGDYALPVVFATWALAYLTVEQQRAFMTELDRLAEARDLTLVVAERPASVAGIDMAPRPDGVPDAMATALVCFDWRDGARTSTRLADLHPHATWLEWLAP